VGDQRLFQRPIARHAIAAPEDLGYVLLTHILLGRLHAARQHDLELVAALLGGGSAGQAHPPDST
jgi:hypothetical protein